MLPKNERGEKITIEDVFHSLNKRLTSIWMGINSSGNSYSGDEFGYRIYDSIDEIKNYIDGFSATIALNATFHPLSLIVRIQELIEANSNIPIIPPPDDSWVIPQVNDFSKIKEELAEYELFLKTIQDVLLHREETEGNTGSNNDRIKINITIEKLGALIYFLINTEDFKKNIKIFNAEPLALSRSLSLILCLRNGETFSPVALSNNSTSFKKSKASLIFWKEKFLSYANQANLLIGKIDE